MQETIHPLVAPHGDVRDCVDPQPRGVATADATVEQVDLGRNFGEQRIERFVQKLKTRHFGVAQVDQDAAASMRAACIAALSGDGASLSLAATLLFRPHYRS